MKPVFVDCVNNAHRIRVEQRGLVVEQVSQTWQREHEVAVLNVNSPKGIYDSLVIGASL